MSAPRQSVPDGTGPFHTEAQVGTLPAVRGVYATSPRGHIARRNRQMLLGACAAAGVQTGAYDEQILTWLSGYEPHTCAVIAGLIARAGSHAASQRDERTAMLALTEAAESHRDRAAGCADCTDQACGNCQHLLTTAGQLDATARRISAGLQGEHPPGSRGRPVNRIREALPSGLRGAPPPTVRSNRAAPPGAPDSARP